MVAVPSPHRPGPEVVVASPTRPSNLLWATFSSHSLSRQNSLAFGLGKAGATMNQDDQEQQGILSTVQSMVVHSAQAGLEVAKSGIETAKNAAQAAGSAVVPLATKAAKIVTKPRKAAAKPRGKPKRSVRSAAVTGPGAKKLSRKTTAKKAVARRPARKPVRKSSSAGRSKSRRGSIRRP